jgi:5-methylcytosine-specific restriction endonuclease McrA
MTRALLLNATYEPHAVIRDRDAVLLRLEQKADVVEYSGREFRSPSIRVALPSVLRLRKYVLMPEKHRSVMLITSNVLARDNYTCAYCGRKNLGPGTGTMDHVIPRALQGPHKWENIVAACIACNGKKGDKTLKEMGWTLKFDPFRPKGVAAHLLRIKPEECWLPYLATQYPR